MRQLRLNCDFSSRASLTDDSWGRNQAKENHWPSHKRRAAATGTQSAQRFCSSKRDHRAECSRLWTLQHLLSTPASRYVCFMCFVGISHRQFSKLGERWFHSKCLFLTHSALGLLSEFQRSPFRCPQHTATPCNQGLFFWKKGVKFSSWRFYNKPSWW